MYIVSFIVSLLSLGFCWYAYWSLLYTAISLILSMVLFYKYFLSPKKDINKKGRSFVFVSFVFSIIAVISAVFMAEMIVGVSLMSSLL